MAESPRRGYFAADGRVMARKKQKQRATVGWLGKDLVRRSKGRCELCASRDGVKPFELWPFPEEPEMDRTLMACARCRRWMEREQVSEPVEARFLEEVIWSQEPAVRLAAARLLVVADFADDPWIRDALDAIHFDPETGEIRDDSAA